MMAATGTLFLGKTGALASTATDGTFVLTLLAHDQISAHQSVPWRITWCGLNAKLFWRAHQHEMKPGRALDIETTRLWPFGNARFGEHEMHATATRIALRPDPFLTT